MYLLGVDGPRDPAKAETWFALGARQHDPVAAYSLGFLLSVVPDHDHDLVRAVELLRISATKGYVPAIHQLGLMLVNHPELAGSTQEAVPLLREASSAGCWKSSVVLGILARDGRSTPADPALASYYFRLAALQGGEAARHYLAGDLAAIARKISSQEDSARATQAAQWFQQHQVPMLFVYREKEQQKNFPIAAIGEYGDTLRAGQ